jgi:putative ABC transport system permease protein
MHKLREDEENDFQIRTQAKADDHAQFHKQLMTALLRLVASISLVIGGIGI